MSVGVAILYLYEQMFETNVRKVASMNNVIATRIKGLSRVALLLVAVVAATIFFMSPSAQASNSAGNAQFDYVTVSTGDTLWSIAQDNVASGSDARDYMYELATLNNLESADLTPGQRIALPNN